MSDMEVFQNMQTIQNYICDKILDLCFLLLGMTLILDLRS